MEMSIVDIAQWLQLINAAAFWPVLWLVGKRYPGWRGRSFTVAGFLFISTITFFMAYFSPAEAEFYLTGSPDGKSLAKATFTRINDQQIRAELQAWRTDNEKQKRCEQTEVNDPELMNHCKLIWDSDSRTVRLVDQYLVLDLQGSSSVLELEVPE
jgi:hypothetical protein